MKYTKYFNRIRKNVLVKDIMSKDVACVDSKDSVKKAAQVMTDKAISTVVILEKEKPIGIVTERDLVQKVLAKKLPLNTKVNEIMSRQPKTIPLNASIKQANTAFTAKNVRHLVVIDGDGKIRGILSQTDVIHSFNQIYSSYQMLLWNPWTAVLIFGVVVMLFLIEILILR